MFHFKKSMWSWLDLGDAIQDQIDKVNKQMFSKITYNFCLNNFTQRYVSEIKICNFICNFILNTRYIMYI